MQLGRRDGEVVPRASWMNGRGKEKKMQKKYKNNFKIDLNEKNARNKNIMPKSPQKIAAAILAKINKNTAPGVPT